MGTKKVSGVQPWEEFGKEHQPTSQANSDFSFMLLGFHCLTSLQSNCCQSPVTKQHYHRFTRNKLITLFLSSERVFHTTIHPDVCRNDCVVQLHRNFCDEHEYKGIGMAERTVKRNPNTAFLGDKT